jgi:hypothetical protein
MYLVGYAAGDSSSSGLRLYLSKRQDAGIWAATVAAAAAETGGKRRTQQQQQAVPQVVRVVAPMRKGPCRIKGSRLVPAAAAAAVAVAGVKAAHTADVESPGDMLVERATPAVVPDAGADAAAQPMQVERPPPLQQQQQQQEGEQPSDQQSTASPTAAAAAVRDVMICRNSSSSSSKRKLKLRPPQQLKRLATSAAAAAAAVTSSTAAAAASVPLSAVWEACGYASLHMMVTAAEAAGGPAAVPAVLKPGPYRFKVRKARKANMLPQVAPQAAPAAAAPAAPAPAAVDGAIVRHAVAAEAVQPAAAAAAVQPADVAEPAKVQFAALLSFPAVVLPQLQGADLLHDLQAVNAALLQLAEAMQLPDDVLLLLPALLVKATAAAAAQETGQCGEQQQQQSDSNARVSLHGRVQAWHAQLAAAAAAADRAAVIVLVKVLSRLLLLL